MDFELFSTQEAFAVARTSPVVGVDVDVAIPDLDPILAVTLAAVLVASISFAVQITRWFAAAAAAAATQVRVTETYAQELTVSPSSSVEHFNLLSTVLTVVHFLERTVSSCSSRKPRTPCQVRSVVRGHVN